MCTCHIVQFQGINPRYFALSYILFVRAIQSAVYGRPVGESQEQ